MLFLLPRSLVLAALVAIGCSAFLSPALKADDAAAVKSAAPSFKNDVLPLLTRYGCNQGVCHGKLAGQNGFRLSLRGYAPEWDHGWIVREFEGRRIDRANPANSLLLKKASGQIPHGGGRLLATDSPGYQLLSVWIAGGALISGAAEPAVERLSVLPGDQILQPGGTVQLAAKAFYVHGRERDVSWLARFFSNDDSVVEVSPECLVKARRPGEIAIRIHFENLVQVVFVTIPFDQPVDSRLYAERRSAIDEHVMTKLAALRIPPSPAADDATFMRRAYLDAIGTLPTSAEVTAFLADSATDKRARLIEQLLERPEWVDYLTLQLSDLLQNRKEHDHDVRGAKGVRRLIAAVPLSMASSRYLMLKAACSLRQMMLPSRAASSAAIPCLGSRCPLKAFITSH